MKVGLSRSTLDSGMDIDFNREDKFRSCMQFQYQTIPAFYSGKTVAITGGTGFVGQGVTEKLLRSCPGIKKIILLIRVKHGIYPKERLRDLCSQPVFDRLRKIDSNFSAKLSCLGCDLAKRDMGLSNGSNHILRSEVEIFIHAAAGLRFNEHLRRAYNLNTKCTQHIVRLCKKLPNLVAFVHVSTAFSNCDRSEIKERVYRWRVKYKDFERSLRWMSDDSIQKITADVQGGKPNTYVLTKAMAEEIIADECDNLPACIIRPGMIIGAWKEPEPGWIGNLYGPTAFMAAYMKGLCRQIVAEHSMPADLVPIDFVVNCVIASAMKTAYDFSALKEHERRTSSCVREITNESDDSSDGIPPIKKDKQVPIYCIVTGTENPLNVKFLYDTIVYWNSQHPALPILPLSDSMYYSNVLYQINSFFTQTIIAYALDFMQLIRLQPCRFVKINRRIMDGMQVMRFFFTHHFTFDIDNLNQLRGSLCESDRREFTTDVSKIDWFDYLRTYTLGVQRFILKESEEDMRDAPRKVAILSRMLRCLKSWLYLSFSTVPAACGSPSAIWDSSFYSWHMKRGSQIRKSV